MDTVALASVAESPSSTVIPASTATGMEAAFLPSVNGIAPARVVTLGATAAAAALKLYVSVTTAATLSLRLMLMPAAPAAPAVKVALAMAALMLDAVPLS